MTHYTVMVKFRGKIEDAKEVITKMLSPYGEELKVEQYIQYERAKRDKYYKDEIKKYEKIVKEQDKSYNIEACKLHLAELKKLTPLKYFKKLVNGYELDKDGNAVSTYNLESKWDWYQIGGRWSGLLKLKKGADGLSGESGIFDNKVGIDVAYLKDLDLTKMKGFATCAVLDEDGWHEPAKTGWFGSTYDRVEDEDVWEKNFKKRFLSGAPKDTVIVIVDCHI